LFNVPTDNETSLCKVHAASSEQPGCQRSKGDWLRPRARRLALQRGAIIVLACARRAGRKGSCQVRVTGSNRDSLMRSLVTCYAIGSAGVALQPDAEC
jgi:hypothetical protein